MSFESMVLSVIGGVVGMGGALAYGFKLMVGGMLKQLTFQNSEIRDLRTGVSEKLDRHIEDCRDCRRRSVSEHSGSGS
jgi:hypothetical protein